MFFLTRRPTHTAQPTDAAQVSLPSGLTHIASYLPRGYCDVSGASMTRGSAASFTTNGAGPALKQTAVNTSIYREITGLPVSQNKYVAVWSGEILGGPTSTTPKLLGISNSATSQSSDYLSIERGSTGDDYLQVISKTGATVVSRQFNVGLTALYGKRITLVGVYSPLEDVARVHVFADNAVATYSSAVTGANAPSVLGTERFVVGVDIVENPTRSANANCNLASIFAGDCTAEYELSIAANPWQVFAPKTRRVFVPVSGGGGGDTSITATLGEAEASAFLANVDLQRAIAAALAPAAASGFSANVDLRRDVLATPAIASAFAPLANVDLQRAITAALGAAAADGYDAVISLAGALTIPASLGVASATGHSANVNLVCALDASTGVAAALGFDATLDTDSPPFTQAQLDYLLAYMQENLVFPPSGAVWLRRR